MAVEIGDQAPDFELTDQHGSPVKLSDFRGAKNVVLVFYPLAFSPVCSGELCAFRDDFPEITRDDVEMLTVSVDSMFTHRAWADAEGFNFELEGREPDPAGARHQRVPEGARDAGLSGT